MTRTLREFAAEQLDEILKEFPSPHDGEAIERWMHHLIATGQVPDDILEAMPEVSRHNEPQIGPVAGVKV
jgi:hypothetical protein